MLFDAALRKVFNDGVQLWRTEPGQIWLRDAFEPFLETRPDIVSEVLRYVTKEKISVSSTGDRQPPMFPCILINPSQSFTIDEYMGDSPEYTVVDGYSLKRTHYRARMDGHEVYCITRHPDFTHYLWLAAMLWLRASKDILAGYGYSGLSVRGDPQRQTGAFDGGDDVTQLITVGAAFEATVALRTRPIPVHDIRVSVGAADPEE